MPATKDDHLYLVDGSGFIFRAYHALPALTRKSDGMPVGAVSGFCNMIHKILSDFTDDDRPSHVAVIFDKSRYSFRNEFYPEYKAHRPEAPEDLKPQFELIRQATRAFSAQFATPAFPRSFPFNDTGYAISTQDLSHGDDASRGS